MFKYGLSLLAFLIVFTNALPQESSFALLDLDAPDSNLHRTKICVNYQQFFLKSLPKSADTALKWDLGWWNNKPNSFDVCKENTARLTNHITPLTYPTKNYGDTENCRKRLNETDFVQTQIDRLIEAGSSSALYLLDKGATSDYHNKNYLFSRFFNPKVSNTTPTFYMYKEQFDEIFSKTSGKPFESISLRFYRPADSFLDAGVLVLLLLSTGCIAIGCFWYASSLRKKLDIGELKIDANGQLVDSNEQETHLPVHSNSSSPEVEKLCCFRATGTCLHIFYTIQALVFVVVILMLSFFYRPVAVEFFNTFIVIGASLCIQKCLTPIFRLCIYDPEYKSLAQIFGINEEKRPQRCWIPAFVYYPIRPIACMLLCFGFTFSLIWRFHMDDPLAYLMLDFMNICICIYSVKASELRSLRLITFFLIAMFVYDIFMVFGTRLFTENGCSVMVQVVTGMDCTKSQRTDFSRDYPIAPVASNYKMPPKIPLLFYVPLLSNPVGHCFDSSIEGDYQHMMLGLGDIIAPGYLISYAFYLDVRKMNRFYLYGLTSLFGYALGMIATFVSLKLMNTAQPALIYLVPFTLIPLVLVCLFKGTLREAWKGNINSIR